MSIKINSQKAITLTHNYVKNNQQSEEGAHDYWHIYRVWKNAQLIGSSEDVDMTVVELAALLHDIADSKFHNGDEEVGPKVAGEYLKSIGVEDGVIEHVTKIIRHMSFKGGNNQSPINSKEFQVVQDADRLDAIGAIGISRCFAFGGYFQRDIHNPDIEPKLNMTKEEYKKSKSTSLNHFYEKLFLLKDRMNTETGRRIAEKRDHFMHQFVDEFLNEWEGLA